MTDPRGFTDWRHEPDEFDRQAERDFDDFEQDDCWNCAGEGYIFDCFDGLCVNAEDGCELCMMRCEYCNPRARDSDGTATAAACEDMPVSKDCQARAESIALPSVPHKGNSDG